MPAPPLRRPDGRPGGAVRTLYAGFGEEVSPLHARRMQAFLEHRPQDAFGRHRYDPADFGWTYAGLAEEFGLHRALPHRDGGPFRDPGAPGTQVAQRFLTPGLLVCRNRNVF